MKKIMKRAVAAVLAMTMLVSLAACGKKGGGSSTAASVDKNTIYKETTMNIDLPKDMSISRSAASENKIFFVGYTYDKEYNSTNYLISCDIDGSNIKQNKLEIKGWVDNLFATPDGCAYISYTDYYEDNSDPDNYVYESYSYIAKYDGDGNKLLEKELSEELDISYISSLSVLNDGKVLINSDTSLYLLDENLAKVKEKELSDNTYINQMVLFSDGTVGASMWGDEGGYIVKKLDINSLELGDAIQFPFSLDAYSFLPGNDKYALLLKTNAAVFGYNIGDSEPTELFNFINSDVSESYFDAFVSLSDGSFLTVYSDWSTDNITTTVSRYVKIDPSEYVEKKNLSIGVTYLDSDVRKSIVDFNKKSDQYRITVIDYSVYETEDNWEAGQEKMNSDIASGNSPDIIMSNDPSLIGNYASKGLFVDLHKFIDNDSSIDINDIWPNLIKACERDGKLYELVPSFYIRTVLGKKSVLSGKAGWSLKEMIEFEKTLPEGTSLLPKTTSREDFTNIMISIAGNQYIDTANATCSFDSDDFKVLLEYLKNLPKQEEINMDDTYYDDYDNMWRSGKVILYPWYFSYLNDYKYVLGGYIGEPVEIVGYPSSDGKGSVLAFWQSLAISSKCKNQEAAWDFIKYYWSEDYQSMCGNIPASMKRFDELAKQAMERSSYTDPETGEVTYYDDSWFVGGSSITLEPLTQQQVDELKDFIKTVDKKIESYNEDILNIINEEAEPFFQGQKSADEVAQIIQSRISIYLKERQ